MDQATFEERTKVLFAQIQKGIEEHGFYAIGVFAGEGFPQFTYTVGLAPDFPELIFMGLHPDTTHQLIWDMVHLTREGTKFEAGHAYTGLIKGEWPLFLGQVTFDEYSKHMGIAMRWHRVMHDRLAFPVMQAVWTDKRGRLPWEKGFDKKFNAKQPLLFDPATYPEKPVVKVARKG